jgi:hypothetical protein
MASFIAGLFWWMLKQTAAQRDRLLEIVLSAVEGLKEAAEELKRRTPRGGRGQ